MNSLVIFVLITLFTFTEAPSDIENEKDKNSYFEKDIIEVFDGDHGYSIESKHERFSRAIIRQKDRNKFLRKKRRRIKINKCCGKRKCVVKSGKSTTPKLFTPTLMITPKKKKGKKKKKTTTAMNGEISMDETTVEMPSNENAPILEVPIISIPVESSIQSSTNVVTPPMVTTKSPTVLGNNSTNSSNAISNTTITTDNSTITTKIDNTTTSIKIDNTTTTIKIDNITTTTKINNITTTSKIDNSTITTKIDNTTTTTKIDNSTTTTTIKINITTITTTLKPCVAVCPSVKPVDETKKNSYGNLINPEQYGLWSSYPTANCNKTYLFSTVAKSYTDAALSCNILGMQLISIETKGELQCVYDANNGMEVPFNENWWSSATDDGCEDTLEFTWCGRMKPMNESFWLPGEPKEPDGSCATILVKAGSTPAVVLKDDTCDSSFVYICEGPVTTCNPECPIFDCTTEPSQFTTDASGSMVLRASEILGTWETPNYFTCDNKTTYLFSSNTKNFQSAMEFCCSIGMKLLSIETAEENQCLIDLNDQKMNYAGINFWTSGYGKNCDDWKYCATNVYIYPDMQWSTNIANKRLCASFYLNNVPPGNYNLEETDCINNLRYICEGAVTTVSPSLLCSPRCPFVECTTQPSLFDSNGVIKAVDLVGRWRTPQYSTCDNKTMYLFSSGPRTYKNAMIFCCSIGMSLLIIENDAEHQCLSDLNTYEMKITNYKLWTGASGMGCNTHYAWCIKYANKYYPRIDLGGALSNDTCGQFSITNGVVDKNLEFFSCDAPFKYICEGPTTTTTCSPVCPTVDCNANASMFLGGVQLIDPDSYGYWNTPTNPICDKDTMYFFSDDEKFFQEAMEACCSMGMTLLSIETPEEHQCLTDLFNKDYLKIEKTITKYWTSGSNLDCKTSYKWCATNVNVYKGIAWATNQPDMAGNKEWCAEISLNRGADNLSVLDDIPCESEIKFICEGPTTTTTTCSPQCPTFDCTTQSSLFIGGSLRDTTVGFWSNASCHVDTLLLFANTPRTFEDAMFFCCSIGMKLLSIENIAKLDCLKYINSVQIFNQIYWTSGVNYKCDSSYKWCSKSTDIANDIIADVLKPRLGKNEWCMDISMSNLPDLGFDSCSLNLNFICEGPTTTTTEATTTTCKANCPYVQFIECTTQSNLFDTFGRLKDPNAVGTWMSPQYSTCDNKTMYLFSSKSSSVLSALLYCCSIGMQLLSIETPAEHTCLTDLNNAEMKYTGSKFWTSGTSFQCNNKYKWCMTNVDVYNGIAWAPNPPDLVDWLNWCGAISMNTGTDDKSIINTINCLDRSPFICEGPTTTTCKPECTAVTCTTQSSLFVSPGMLKDPGTIGTWHTPTYHTCDNKTLYLFSSTSKTYLDAMKYCCSIGMTLLSIETTNEYQCLNDLNSDQLKYGANIWTSGSNLKCRYQFQWCPSQIGLYNDIPWETAYPTYTDLNACVQIYLSAAGGVNKSVLMDYPCTDSIKFVCEGPTTTTCKPECPVVDCTTQASLFISDGMVKSPETIGSWQTPTYSTCTNMTMYLFSSLTKNFLDAMKYCCSIGMKLLSIETAAEHTCLTDLNNDKLKSTSYYWTSGSNLQCKSGSYKWCSSQLDFYPGITWQSGEPSYAANEWCAQLYLNTGVQAALADFSCDITANFICEGPTTTTCKPECPVIDCTTQTSLFLSDGTVTTPNSIGSWHIPTYSTCTNMTMYLFSSTIKNFSDAMKYCCSVGMKLLSIDTAAEHTCLTDLNNDKLKSTSYYWTSGSNLQCKSGSYKWCSSQLDFYPGITWQSGQPSYAANEWCAQLYLNTGVQAALADFSCDITANFICEGPTTTTCKPECPVIDCTTQTSLFLSDGTVTTPNSIGFWHIPMYSTCTNMTMYLFSSTNKNFSDAMKYCCSIGMKLLSIDTAAEHTCLTDLNNDKLKSTSYYWTSGSNLQCKSGSYKWCSSQLDFYPGITWQSGQPSYAANEWCAQLYLNTGVQAALADFSCDITANFICEGPTTTTCKPECPVIDCTTQTSLFLSDGTVTTPNSIGSWHIPMFSTCTNMTMYLFSSTIKNFSDAMKYCCSIGMKLLSIDTAAEHTCLTDLNNEKLKSTSYYWTSGSNLQCKSGSYKWCPSKLDFYPGITWQSGEPSYAANEWCAQLYLNTGVQAALADFNCDLTANFICEGPTTTTCKPECPIIDCTTQTALFLSDGTVTTPNSIGSWHIPMYSTCTNMTMYLFSSTNKNFSDAMKYCCSVGMKLLSIDTAAEHTCLTDLNNDKLKSTSYYWTSGSNLQCKSGSYKWCSSQLDFYPGITWQSGEPSYAANEWCAQLYLNTGIQAALADFSCDIAANFICEGPTTTCIPECTIVDCTPLAAMYGIDGEVTTPNSVGIWKTPTFSTCDNKTLYFFSNTLMNVVDATKYCCSIGMKLLSIETLNEFKCIVDLNIADMQMTEIFWTSGSNLNCASGGYKWCATNTKFTADAPWGVAPDHTLFNEWCAELWISTGHFPTSYFNDYICANNRRFICEGPTTTTTTCATPTCTDISCDKDAILFGANNALIAPATFGRFFNVCGSNYMFSSSLTSYCTARKICCRIGMELLSLHTLSEADCLYDFNTANVGASSWHYVSARTNTPGTGFEWCPSKDPVDNIWSPGEPSNGANPENVGMILLDNRVTGRNQILGDNYPQYPLNFICEATTVKP